MKPGMTGERVLLLRARLGLPDGDQYDDALRTRVRRFQSAHGLPVDGIAGARTITALNGGSGRPIVDRRDILRLNLERARLLP
ncbi:peptidoglycan-binding protein, partial [Escherichia coli]|nr:peptidoglycan-binding protein [Escherichia coli]